MIQRIVSRPIDPRSTPTRQQRERVFTQLDLGLNSAKDALLELCGYFLSHTDTPLFVPDALCDIYWLAERTLKASYPVRLTDEQRAKIGQLCSEGRFISNQANLCLYLLHGHNGPEAIEATDRLTIQARSYAFALRKLYQEVYVYRSPEEMAA